MTHTKYVIQKLLDKCSDFANDFGLYFNSQKQNKQKQKHGVNDMGDPVQLNDAPLSVLISEEQLGYVLSTNGPFVNFENIIRDINGRTNFLKRGFHYLDYAAKCKLFNDHSTSFYGTQQMDLFFNDYNCLYKDWRKPVRFLLNLYLMTHDTLLPTMTGSTSVEKKIRSRLLGFM